jgi:hypothetical protein
MQRARDQMAPQDLKQWRQEKLEKFKRTPLICCEVRDFVGDKVLVRLPNGNEFLVDMAEGCGKICIGDTVLAEQKNLTVVKKVPQSKRFDADKFVIVEKPLCLKLSEAKTILQESRKKEIDQYLPRVLEDISEGLHAGLTVIESIEEASKRHYGWITSLVVSLLIVGVLYAGLVVLLRAELPKGPLGI